MTSDYVALAITVSVLSAGIRAVRTPDHVTSQPVTIIEFHRQYPGICQLISDFYAVITQKE
jgi:hypothetical protein